MRSMRLSELRKRSNKYFKKIGNVSSRTGKRTAEYIAKRSYEALPKRWKEYVSKDDEKRFIKMIAHALPYSGEKGINIFDAMKQAVREPYKRIYTSQKRELWNNFRVLESAVYNHFNTYMYRLGYSASKYWFENVEFSNKGGSVVTATLYLPQKAGKSYTVLEMLYDYSGTYLNAYMA